MSSFSNIAKHMQTSKIMQTKPRVKFDFPGGKNNFQDFLLSLLQFLSFFLSIFSTLPYFHLLSFHLFPYVLFLSLYHLPLQHRSITKESKDPR